MKKFLSLLLAMTMILSLVIVPAQANDSTEYRVLSTSSTISVTADKNTVDGDETVHLTATPTITVQKKTATDTDWQNCAEGEYDLSYAWNNANGNDETATASWSAGAEDSQKTVTCTVTATVDGKEIGSVDGSTTVTVKAAPAVVYAVSGKPTVKAMVDGKEVSSVNHDTTVNFSVNGNITVTRKTGDAPAETLTEGYTLDYNWTGVSGSGASFSEKLTNTTSAPKAVTARCTITVKVNGQTVGDPVSCTPASVTVASAPDIAITANVDKIGDNYEVLKGGTLRLTASATGVENPSYKWYVNSGMVAEGATYSPSTASTGTVTVTCRVFSGNSETAAKEVTCNYKIVDEDVRLSLDKDSITLTKKGAYEDVTASLIDWSTNRAVSGTVSYTFTPSKSGIVTLSSTKNTTGKTRITLDATGTVTITVEATYKGKTLPSKSISVSGELLSGSLKEVENGDSLSFDYDDLKTAANKALPSRVSVKNNSYINLSNVPTASNEGGTLYYGSNKVSASGRNVAYNDDLVFNAADGFIGDATMTMSVTGDDNNTYVITLTIPVVSAGDIKETVTGSSANSSVSFDVDDVVDYDYLYIHGSATGTNSNRTFTPSNLSSTSTGYNGYWDGKAKSGWVLFDDNDTVTIPASAFSKSSGKVTLYVVGIDDDDVAYTGTIEVSQKSYAITYNVVAGSSVSFEQEAFEDFMDDYADDNISSNRGDYFEFDYVKFSSLPTSSNGVLYVGSSKVKTSDEISDLDKVTFDAAAKAKGTITVPFTLYAKQYDKNDKVIDKKVTMSGSVEISVIKEDIVFEVGVNSSVKFDDSAFVSYLQGYSSSYRKATLSYVTFNVGRNSAITSYFNGTGALYRYYSPYGVSSTVSSSDEFYYNPKSSSKNYDLADVTYVTSKFAKAGDVVYIPFTAYGTGSQKAEGTVAIKVKQTMNFTDVHTYDYFYDAVQWAVNNDITKGTSATTFSPKTGCTRAQIVTFLWRAAGSPAPRSSVNKFTDVTTAHADYMKAIIWATEQGITTGTDTNKFSPDATCTRAQIVTFLYRYKSNPAVYGSLNFTDVNKTEHSAYYNAILWAVNNKIATGYGNSTFDPNGTCNRGDAVTFLYRALA